MGKNFLSQRWAILSVLCVINGCVSTPYHEKELHSSKEREVTVGIVQKEIRVGMTGAEVASILGSPNIVTKDRKGRETWIYDKIATEASYSRSRGTIGGGSAGGGFVGSALILGVLGGDYAKEAGASATTQKTLTVVIKFNKDNLVETFSYHASKF